MQCQLFCTGRSHCDFILWTTNDIYVERVYPDESFWKSNIEKVKHFFEAAVMPELTGRFFSRTSSLNQSTSTTMATAAVSPDNGEHSGSTSEGAMEIGEKLYCYCRGPEEGDMVGCDNRNCQYEWFHLTCLGLNTLPKKKHWYCPDCRKLPQFSFQKNFKTVNNDYTLRTILSEVHGHCLPKNVSLWPLDNRL